MHIIQDFLFQIILGVILFLCGVLWAEPVKRNISHWRKRKKLHQREPVAARIFFIKNATVSDALRQLLINQNGEQYLFEIEIARWDQWSEKESAEQRLRSLNTPSRLSCCDAFQKEMLFFNQNQPILSKRVINIAITEIPLPNNYYAWNTQDKNGIVISIHSLNHLFSEDNDKFQMIILRIIQRMLIFSLDIKDLLAHENTCGCLFDLTRDLTDIQYSANKTFLCHQCRTIIHDACGWEVIQEIEHWISVKSVH